MRIKFAGCALAAVPALGSTAANASGSSPTATPIVLTLAQYVQDFDTLSNTASATSNVLPDGWQLFEGTNGAAADGSYAVGTGSSTAGGAYSFGSAGSTDRALGSLGSSAATPIYYGAFFTNSTGVAITSLNVAYKGEQWRRGTSGDDGLTFAYSTNATTAAGINAGTWNSVAALAFATPNTAASVGVLDGNAAGNFSNIVYTITGLNIAAGSTFAIRWADIDSGGTDDGLGIDDVKITANAVPEAGTWAMMTVGFGLLGAAMRRRTKTVFA